VITIAGIESLHFSCGCTGSCTGPVLQFQGLLAIGHPHRRLINAIAKRKFTIADALT